MTKNKPAAATMPKIPLFFPITAEATLLALEAMVCVALPFLPLFSHLFSLPGMLSDTGVSARTSAGFPFCLLCRFHRLPELSHTKTGFSHFHGTGFCRRAFLLCSPRLVRCMAYRRALSAISSARCVPSTAAFSCSASWAFP